VSPPSNPWAVATLEWDGLSCEPLLSSTGERPGAPETAAVSGGLRRRSFNEVMAAYTACLARLLRPGDPTGEPSHRLWHRYRGRAIRPCKGLPEGCGLGGWV
jgi:hypothetical protein